MTQAQTISSGTLSASDLFAVLSIDRLRLLLPHHQVRTLEPVSDIDLSKKQNREVGWLEAGEVKSPIYCFSRDLVVLETIPNERRIAVVMVADTGSIGVLCDDLNIMPRDDFISHPLPVSMNTSGTPLTGLAIHDDAICCLSSANHLLEYVSNNANLINSRPHS